MEIQIELSEQTMELILIQSAKLEIPAEELVVKAIQNYMMKRGDDNAD